MAGTSGPVETTLTLELKESQIARLRQELDGSRTLAEALGAAVDGDAARDEGIALAQRMLEVGFLELGDPGAQL